jgi:hypothetical protein
MLFSVRQWREGLDQVSPPNTTSLAAYYSAAHDRIVFSKILNPHTPGDCILVLIHEHEVAIFNRELV